jgi:hypothetical protein
VGSTLKKEVEMRFLWTIEGVTGGTSIPPEQMITLLKANFDWVERLTKSGRSEITYGIADHMGGLTGGFCIHNVETAEQLAEDMATCPAAGLSTMKLYPLVTMEASKKIFESMCSKMPKK